MTNPPNDQAAAWVPLLVVGISLNTLGIVLSGAGVLRWVLMGAGLLLILFCVVKMVSQGRGKPPSRP